MTTRVENEPRCGTCSLRRKAEERPKSFFAWLWRLHTRICPGWRAYQRSLEASESPE